MASALVELVDLFVHTKKLVEQDKIVLTRGPAREFALLLLKAGVDFTVVHGFEVEAGNVLFEIPHNSAFVDGLLGRSPEIKNCVMRLDVPRHSV